VEFLRRIAPQLMANQNRQNSPGARSQSLGNFSQQGTLRCKFKPSPNSLRQSPSRDFPLPTVAPYFTMLRQAVLAPSRAAQSSFRAPPRTPAIRNQFRSQPLISARPGHLGFPRRWYSAEAESTPKQPSEAPEEGGDAPSAAEGQKAGEGAQAPEIEAAKKELEAKSKEARDWKVCPTDEENARACC